MVEPHLVLPEAEIKRLEEIEKKYNLLKHECAKTDEKLKNHMCDHSDCEKKIAELKDKYEKLEKSPDNTTKEKESTEEMLHAGTSQNYAPASNAEVSTSSTSNKPWYYIGPLEDN